VTNHFERESYKSKEIVFGNNDCLITCTAPDFKQADTVLIQKLPPNDDQVGTLYETGRDAPNLEILAALKFNNTESLDVFIGQLQQLRKTLGMEYEESLRANPLKPADKPLPLAKESQ